GGLRGAHALPEPGGEAVLDGHRRERPGHLTGRQLITQDEQPDKQTRRARLPGVAADRRRIRAVESRHRGPSQRRLEPGDGEVVLAQMGGEGRGEAREGGGGCGHGEGSLSSGRGSGAGASGSGRPESSEAPGSSGPATSAEGWSERGSSPRTLGGNAASPGIRIDGGA